MRSTSECKSARASAPFPLICCWSDAPSVCSMASPNSLIRAWIPWRLSLTIPRVLAVREKLPFGKRERSWKRGTCQGRSMSSGISTPIWTPSPPPTATCDCSNCEANHRLPLTTKSLQSMAACLPSVPLRVLLPNHVPFAFRLLGRRGGRL